MIKIKMVAGNQTHNLFSMMSPFSLRDYVPSDGGVNGKPETQVS